MFTNKIYDVIKQYLDRYLFGFDKNQLNMSILKGNINLKSVNIRPDEANRLIDGLMLPVSLKAGMIGNLQIKFSILSVWSNPLELTIDDLYLILGPNMSFVSHDESYIADEELDESYDSTNVFNIFEHELQIKKKTKNIDKASSQNQQQQQNQEENDDSLRNNFNSLMKNLKLSIKNLHIRFEDDYFSADSPYSFGVVTDKLDLTTSDTEWTFDSLLHLNFFRSKPQHLDQEKKDEGVIILKELSLTNARIYVNSMSEMFIPSSLWEQTRHLENQIFDAMPVESLRDLMKEVFTRKENSFYLISEFNLFANFYIYKQNPPSSNKGPSYKPFALARMTLLFTPFKFSLTPQLVDDMSRFYEFVQNFSISLDLKQYRPQRRPICLSEMNNQDIQDDHIKRKKKLIVRDWFFFVVWYIRLRNLLNNYYSEQLIEQEIENNQDKYKGLMQAAQNGKSNIKEYLDQQNKINQQQQPADSADNSKKYDDFRILLKFQGIGLQLYEDLDKYKTKDQTLPSFELDFDTLVFESHSNFISNQIKKNLLFKDLKLFHTQSFNRDQTFGFTQFHTNNNQDQDYAKLTLHSNTSNNINLQDNMRCLTERENLSMMRGGPTNLKTNPGQLYNHQQNSSIGTSKNSSSNLPVFNQKQSSNRIVGNSAISAVLTGQQASQYGVRKQIRNSDYNQSNIDQIMNESSSVYKEVSSQYQYTGGATGGNGAALYSHLNQTSVNVASYSNFTQRYPAANSHSNNGGSMISNSNQSQRMQQEEGQNVKQQVSQNQQNSILDIFGLKQTFESFFDKLTGNSSQNNAQNQIQVNQSLQQSQKQYPQTNRLHQAQSPTSQGSNSQNYFDNNPKLNNTQNFQTILNTGDRSRYIENQKTPFKGRVQQVGNTGLKTGGYQRNQNQLSNNNTNQDLHTQSAPQNRRNQSYNFPAQNSNLQSQSQMVPLSQQQQRWPSDFYDHQRDRQKCIVRTQIAQLSSINQSTVASFHLIEDKLFGQNQRTMMLNNGRPSCLNMDIQIGNFELQYCNEIVKNACDLIVAYKQLHMFRYVPLKNLFQRRENIHRKIELHAPLYLIKKLFVKSSNKESMIFQRKSQENLKQVEKQKPSTKILSMHIKGQQKAQQESSEDENISDYEEQEQKNTRKNIQQAVSQKNGTQITSKSNKAFEKFKNEEKHKLDLINSVGGKQNFEEDLLIKKAIQYEQQYTKVDININVRLNHSEIIVLQPRLSLDQAQNIMCRLLFNQQQMSAYKNREESGFDAFGMQFQTFNKFEMMYYFTKNLRNGLDSYLKNPVFESARSTTFDKMRQVFRMNTRAKSYAGNQNNRDTMKHIMDQSDNAGSNDIFNQKVSPQKLIFNAQGVKEQEEMFNKGKAKIKKTGKKQQSHYDAMFAQIDDDKSSQSHTPQLSYKNLNLTDNHKQEYQSIKDSKIGLNFNVISKKQQNQIEDDQFNENSMNLKVLCTDENEKEEQKDLKNFINGSEKTPLITSKRKSQNNLQKAQTGSPQNLQIQKQKDKQTNFKDLGSPRTLQEAFIDQYSKTPLANPNIQGFQQHLPQAAVSMHISDKQLSNLNSTHQKNLSKQLNQSKANLQRGAISQQQEDDQTQNDPSRGISKTLENRGAQNQSSKQYSTHGNNGGQSVKSQNRAKNQSKDHLSEQRRQSQANNSEYDDDLFGQERDDESSNAISFAVSLTKQMKTTALKKTYFFRLQPICLILCTVLKVFYRYIYQNQIKLEFKPSITIIIATKSQHLKFNQNYVRTLIIAFKTIFTIAKFTLAITIESFTKFTFELRWQQSSITKIIVEQQLCSQESSHLWNEKQMIKVYQTGEKNELYFFINNQQNLKVLFSIIHLLKNTSDFLNFDLSRKDTMPIFSHHYINQTQNHNNNNGENSMNTNGKDNNVEPILHSDKYVGILISLDVISFVIIVLLAISANKAYKFMAHKDRILLLHFIFLEASLFCKTLSLFFGAMYNADADGMQQKDTWVQFYIFIENLGFVTFFLACSFNLYKWEIQRILLVNRIDLYVSKRSQIQFDEKRKIQFGVFISVITLVTVVQLIIISIDSSIENDQDAIVIDRVLNMIYAINGIVLGIAFIVVGSLLLKKLNLYYEDIYEEKRKSIIFGIALVFLSLFLISVRFIYQDIFQEYFSDLKYKSFVQSSWDYPIYEFCAVFFFEFLPILAQVIMIWTAAQKNWTHLKQNSQHNSEQYQNTRQCAVRDTLLKSNNILITDDESLLSSNEDAIIRQSNFGQSPRNQNRNISYRDHYTSTDFAFNNQQIFQFDVADKAKMEQLKQELFPNEEGFSNSEYVSSSSGVGSGSSIKSIFPSQNTMLLEAQKD